MLDAGEARSGAAVARQVGVTPVAITRVLSLLRLAPEIQEYIENGMGAPGAFVLTEKACRIMLRLRTHEQQVEAFRVLVRGSDHQRSIERPSTSAK